MIVAALPRGRMVEAMREAQRSRLASSASLRLGWKRGPDREGAGGRARQPRRRPEAAAGGAGRVEPQGGGSGTARAGAGKPSAVVPSAVAVQWW